jgi:DNA-binding NarL/FixJ family response regulator
MGLQQNNVSGLCSGKIVRPETTKNCSFAPVRIALVDDDNGFYTAVNEMAKSENWALDYYPNGYEAAQRIPATHPDIVLMDIRMPGLSGIESTQKLKCLAPILPIIMLTAYSEFDNIVFSLMAGTIGYLLKPVSLEQFKDAVSGVVRGGTALCDEAQAILLAFIRRAFTLGSPVVHSRRELQIMICLAQHLSDKEIAERLPNT